MCDAATRLAAAVRDLFATLDADGVYVESPAIGRRLDAAQARVVSILDEIAPDETAAGAGAP